MKPNRDMFYSNYQAGGFQESNMIYTPPQGYSINQNYQAYGPNVMGSIPNNQVQNNYNTGGYVDEYDERITKIERQIRRLDQRIRKLESNTGIIEETDSNLYMI